MRDWVCPCGRAGSAGYSTRLVGDVSLGAGGTTTTFSGLPDSPISSLRLDFAGGNGGQFTAGADLCSTPVDISGGPIQHFDRDAFKKDVDHVLSP